MKNLSDQIDTLDISFNENSNILTTSHTVINIIKNIPSVSNEPFIVDNRYNIKLEEFNALDISFNSYKTAINSKINNEAVINFIGLILFGFSVCIRS